MSLGDVNVDRALDRIARWDAGPDGLNAVRELAPVRGNSDPTAPLAGVPVLVKDCIDVVGQTTAAGSVALEGATPRRNSTVAERLLGDGAVILGKANQSELSGWVTFDAPSGYSALGGLSKSPYPGLDPGGSSSGPAIAVAAGYVALAVGTDTGGSVLKPAGMNNVFGLRPTLGAISGAGIVPITPSQDTAGPIAADVRTLAAGLSSLLGVAPVDRYERHLDSRRSAGVRVGVPVHVPVASVDRPAWRQHLALLRERGVVLVPVEQDLPWDGHGDLTVPTYDFRDRIGDYLAGVDVPSKVADFDALVAHYLDDPDRRLRYGGRNLLRSAEVDLDRDRPRRDVVWAHEHSSSRQSLIELAEDGLEAVLFPQSAAAYLASKSGHPAITIPGRRRADHAFSYTTLLATEPGAEQLLLDLALGVEESSGPREVPDLAADSTTEHRSQTRREQQ